MNVNQEQFLMSKVDIENLSFSGLKWKQILSFSSALEIKMGACTSIKFGVYKPYDKKGYIGLVTLHHRNSKETLFEKAGFVSQEQAKLSVEEWWLGYVISNFIEQESTLTKSSLSSNEPLDEGRFTPGGRPEDYS